MRACAALLVAAAALSALGCASGRPSGRGIEIADRARFDLLAPAELGASIALEQQIRASYGSETRSFHCLLEVEPAKLVLVGLTPLGTRAFTLTLEGSRLSVDALQRADLPSEPARILADLQLSLWPRLPREIGLDVRESWSESGGGLRELVRGEHVVIRVRYDASPRWARHLVFEHLERGYSLDVTTLDATTLGATNLGAAAPAEEQLTR